MIISNIIELITGVALFLFGMTLMGAGWVICLSGIDAGSGWLMLFSTDTLTCLTGLFGI